MNEIDDYLAGLAPLRRERVLALHGLIIGRCPGARFSFRYRMPTYECNGGWLALASQKHYLSLYTCDTRHIAAFRERHPGIRSGKGCINLRDRDDLPLADLAAVVDRALGIAL